MSSDLPSSQPLSSQHVLGEADDALDLVVIAARNEADRIGETVSALRREFPAALIVVGDDGSGDTTAATAAAAGAEVVTLGRGRGKGQAATAAAQRGLELAGATAPRVVLLCDADLGPSAKRFRPLVDAVNSGSADLAIAGFERRLGGGFGLALGFARWAIRRRCGFEAGSPISGQRALTGSALNQLLPFAPGFGMEIAMTVRAARAGLRIQEIQLDLSHRATGRTWKGFIHRGRQLRDFVRAYVAVGRARNPGQMN